MLRSLFAVASVLALAACADPHTPAPSEPVPASAPNSGTSASSAAVNQTGTRAQLRNPPVRASKAAPTPSEPATSKPAGDPTAAAWVAAHNLQRARVSPAANPALPPVRWSPQLAAVAHNWAQRCEFEHSRGDHGENLSARTYMASPDDVVASWAAESQHYDYGKGRCAAGKVCGHYTQVVWRDSTEIGCAAAQCEGGGPFGGGSWILWVCNYSPAGNWSGERPY